MIDAHDEAIGAAKPGRKVIVSEPCRATHTGPQRVRCVIPAETHGVVATLPSGEGSRAVIGIEVRLPTGGIYRLRVERDQWCNLDLEPVRG